ncbi:hypothetical protein N9A86_05480, partial [Akkermansiaceae bacterium]|nr:hypothetical protein [Akkermansiaceae bacterium]
KRREHHEHFSNGHSQPPKEGPLVKDSSQPHYFDFSGKFSNPSDNAQETLHFKNQFLDKSHLHAL